MGLCGWVGFGSYVRGWCYVMWVGGVWELCVWVVLCNVGGWGLGVMCMGGVM